MLSSIVVGKTTKEDILLTFGCPTSESADEDTFWYVWKVTKGYIGYCLAAGGAAEAGVFSPASYRILQISFDCSDTVNSYNLDKESKVDPIWGFGTHD
jgi:outer membrane protein assembly factor BamE (lipoprotein component of BamABCDE complex)